MSKVTTYKSITGQPHAYPYYNSQNTFIAPKGVSPYNVASDLTRLYRFYDKKTKTWVIIRRPAAPEYAINFPYPPCRKNYRDAIGYLHQLSYFDPATY